MDAKGGPTVTTSPATAIVHEPSIEPAALRRFQSNLDALSIIQPDVARGVEATKIPESVACAVGRDGNSTFLLTDTVGKRRWFGGSSMPSISAVESLAGFVSDGTNITLPGILTGAELLLLAGRCPAHVAIYIAERDPLQLRLAFHLYDYVELIRGGRLVILMGDEPQERLRAWVEGHPGYELPSQIIRVPQRRLAEIHDLQRRFEASGERLTASIQENVTAIRSSLQQRIYGPLPDRPRIAVISIDARSESLREMPGVVRSLGGIGWPHESCLPDQPQHIHTLARLRIIQRCAAEAVIVLGPCPKALRSLLPDELPVATWHLPTSPSSDAGVESTQRRDVFVVPTADAARRLRDAGLSADRIHVSPPAMDATLIPVAGKPEGRAGDSSPSIAFLMDSPDDRPESCDVTWTSHVTLWRALQTIILENPDEEEASVEMLLSRGEEKSGTTLTDASIRRMFKDFLAARILPACRGRAWVASIATQGHDLGVWGQGWPVRSGGGDPRRGPIPGPAERMRIFAGARVAVLPENSIRAIQWALESLAVGTPAIVRGSRGGFVETYPDLVGIAPYLTFFQTSRELTTAVADASARKAPCDRDIGLARELVLKEHTLARRLERMIAWWRSVAESVSESKRRGDRGEGDHPCGTCSTAQL